MEDDGIWPKCYISMSWRHGGVGTEFSPTAKQRKLINALFEDLGEPLTNIISDEKETEFYGDWRLK